MTVKAQTLLEMLDKFQTQLNGAWDYDHILPFNIEEVQEFLDGKPGADVSGMRGYTRSSQVEQAVSCIGAYVVDRDIADADTYACYKALWEMQKPYQCQYCNKKAFTKLMMGSTTHCNAKRCTLAAFRDSF